MLTYYDFYLREQEEDDYNELNVWIDSVRKNCDILQPIFFRGMKHTNPYGSKTVRKDRKPLNTKLDIHNIADELFYKYFGIKARSQSVFAYNNHQHLSLYINSIKDIFIIIPKTPAEYIWSDSIDDLTMHWHEYKSKARKQGATREDDIEFLDKEISSEYQKSKDVPNTTSEIMCYCSEYYLIQKHFIEKVLNIDIQPKTTVKKLLDDIQKSIDLLQD